MTYVAFNSAACWSSSFFSILKESNASSEAYTEPVAGSVFLAKLQDSHVPSDTDHTISKGICVQESGSEDMQSRSNWIFERIDLDLPDSVWARGTVPTISASTSDNECRLLTK